VLFHVHILDSRRPDQRRAAPNTFGASALSVHEHSRDALGEPSVGREGLGIVGASGSGDFPTTALARLQLARQRGNVERRMSGWLRGAQKTVLAALIGPHDRTRRHRGRAHRGRRSRSEVAAARPRSAVSRDSSTVTSRNTPAHIPGQGDAA